MASPATQPGRRLATYSASRRAKGRFRYASWRAKRTSRSPPPWASRGAPFKLTCDGFTKSSDRKPDRIDNTGLRRLPRLAQESPPPPGCPQSSRLSNRFEMDYTKLPLCGPHPRRRASRAATRLDLLSTLGRWRWSARRTAYPVPDRGEGW